ncbi:beta-ketoacyl reductase [Streptomyces diacarni]|uniref:acyl carrier protein n=1 Tax=Streptomyces diacarni TaxID=2800381 RepID=UPI0033E3633A
MTGALAGTDRDRLTRGGLVPLTTEQGMALLDTALERPDDAFLVAAQLDTRALRGMAEAGTLAQVLRGVVDVPVRGSGQPSAGAAPLLGRLSGLPEPEREAALLELLLEEISAVLGHDSARAIDPERGLLDMGFDSLSALELRNRLTAATRLRFPSTLVFDHPTPRRLARHVSGLLSPNGEEAVDGVGGSGPDGDGDLRAAIAAIPLARLREAGLMDTLLRLAGRGPVSAAPAASDEERIEHIKDAALDDLVRMALADGEE